MSEKIDLKKMLFQQAQQAAMSGVPTDSVTLPSRGKVYPADSSLHLATHLDIRMMTAREEDILTSRALLKQGKAISTLLTACLMDKSIDCDSMLMGDRNAILTAIRISGYGHEYTISATCPACSEDVKEYTFDLSKLPLKMLDVDPITPGVNLFSYKLPSGMNVTFKLMTGADERELQKAADNRKKSGIVGLENNVTSRLMSQVVSIDDETDRARIERIIMTLPAGESRALRRYMDDIAPSVDMTQTMTCPLCGEDTEVDVPFGTEFFWPSR